MTFLYKIIISRILKKAGYKIGGNFCVKDDRFYKTVLVNGSLGLAESYMKEWWDLSKIDDLIYNLLRLKVDKKFGRQLRIIQQILSLHTNKQNQKKSVENVQHHYDRGDDVYEAMLDEDRVYSCAYWKNAETLEEAQRHKFRLICEKLKLHPGMKVLDIGCGWGGLAKYMAKEYSAIVVGITLSKDQHRIATKKCHGLSVEIRLQDYRDVCDKFDRVVSVGMFEHVGPKNYKTYFKKVASLLKEDGLSLLHTIGSNDPIGGTDPFIHKYIFPNGVIPTKEKILKTCKGLLYQLDWHDFGTDYDTTLMEWHRRFNKNWHQKLSAKYPAEFRRMWNFYLLSCAGAFRAEKISLWQIMLAKKDMPNYEIAR